MPSLRRASTARNAVSRALSATPMTPRTVPARRTTSAVAPRPRMSARHSRRASGSAPSPPSISGLPTSASWPATWPRTPRPTTVVMASGEATGMPSRRALSTMAVASGCVQSFSRQAAQPMTSAASSPSMGTTVVTSGRPSVRVPVLSNSTASARAASSRYCPPLTRMPRRAARPTAATVAVGPAMSSAHGQPATSTATARSRSPVIVQASAARPSTVGVNHAAQRSTMRAARGLPASAATTSRTTLPKVESSPTLTARASTRPV